jgi:hypothetical protein
LKLLSNTFPTLLLDLALLPDPSAGSGTFEELLDFGVTLEEDFAELRLDEDSSSQSSHTLEDESSEGRVAKSLSSSPQAIKSRANKKSSKEFFIVVNITLF